MDVPAIRSAAPSRLPFFIVDAFADAPFTGNPAGVVLLKQPVGLDLMRDVAAELNLSETAFVLADDTGWDLPEIAGTGPDHDERDLFSLRWLTPRAEVDLCGHATLGAAHVLYDAGRLDLHTPVRFRTRSGIVRALPAGREHGAVRWTLDFPSARPVAADPPRVLCEALGVREPVWVGRATFGDGPDDVDWFVELASPRDVVSLAPDLRRLCHIESRGVIVTAPSDADAPGEFAGYDAVSRCFYPRLGVDEDPVTGSAHCAVGPHAADRLGRDAVRCRQASRRGGTVDVRLAGDRVELTGKAVMTARGELLAGV